MQECVEEILDFLGQDSEFTLAQIQAAATKAELDSDDAIELLLDGDEEVLAATECLGGEESDSGTRVEEDSDVLSSTARTDAHPAASADVAEASTLDGSSATTTSRSPLSFGASNAASSTTPTPSFFPTFATSTLQTTASSTRPSTSAAHSAVLKAPSMLASLLGDCERAEAPHVTVLETEARHVLPELAASEFQIGQVGGRSKVPSGRKLELEVRAFAFDEPSPDDRVRTARAGQLVKGGAKARHVVRSVAKNVMQQHGTTEEPADGVAAYSGGDPLASILPRSQRNRPSARQVREEARRKRKHRHQGLAKMYTSSADGSDADGVDYRRQSPLDSVAVAVAGVAGSGRSTLIGQLMIHTGRVSRKEAYAVEQRARAQDAKDQQYAWLVRDRVASIQLRAQLKKKVQQQKRKQKTKRQESTRMTLFDHAAPVEGNVTASLAAGIHEADAVLLVLSAEGDGSGDVAGLSFVQECLSVAHFAQRKPVVVAVTRMDKAKFSQRRYDQVCHSLHRFIAKHNIEPKPVFVPVNAWTGDNVAFAQDSRFKLWYNGPTLIDALTSAAELCDREDEPSLHSLPLFAERWVPDPAAKLAAQRVPLHVVSGALLTDDKLRAVPSGERFTVQALEDAMCEPCPKGGALAGHLVYAQLEREGSDDSGPIDGFVLDDECGRHEFSVGEPMRECRVLVFTLGALLSPMQVGDRVELLVGSGLRQPTSGRVSRIECILDATTWSVVKHSPSQVGRHSTAVLHVELEEKVWMHSAGGGVLSLVALASAGEGVVAVGRQFADDVYTLGS